MIDRYGNEIEERSAYGVADCDLCDADGYRNFHVCDHVDHSAAAARGMALIRSVLRKAEEK